MLTLKVSDNSPSNQNETHVFDESGGSIGRNRDNDLVLHDPNHFLSRQHAIISYQDGAYYLTDLSENGVFLNRADQPVGKNNTVKLTDHDCLGLGEYELEVSIGVSDRPEIQERYETGPELAGANPIPSPSPWVSTESDIAAPRILDGNTEPKEVPDYPYHDSRVLRAKSDKQSAAESNHSAAEHDFFRPPPMQQENSRLDWDKPEFASAVDAESPGPDWDNTDFVAPVRAKEKAPDDTGSGDHSAAHVPPRSYEPVEPSADSKGFWSMGYQPEQTPQVAFEEKLEPAPKGEHLQSELPQREAKALQEFLDGVGLKSEQLSPDAGEALMRLQGKLYREIVQGMMEVLRARFELKNEFRMRHTQLQIKENNPLKFIGQVDDALEYLVFRRTSGFLDPEAAFDEAFQDIKDHQVAMVVGMRAAFNSLLERFDPNELEQRFAKGSKINSLLPLYKQASCWQRYREWYADVAAAAEDDFQGLFGNEFARAYEDQMARLSLLRRNTDK
ncbi:MAG: type VI secretion system-associated FHA domain protein TagH [Gammaproteobacteria bacterium]|nr:type VI secretion system-associated FHA domain protein TagH [Gammaproteobacteria bacterium]